MKRFIVVAITFVACSAVVVFAADQQQIERSELRKQRMQQFMERMRGPGPNRYDQFRKQKQAQTQQQPGQAQTQQQLNQPQIPGWPGTQLGATTAAAEPVVKDPNAVKAEVEKFEGLAEQLAKLDRDRDQGMLRWTRSLDKEKLGELRAAHKQIAGELMLLRKLAAEEGAAKTVAAIDHIMLARVQRQEKLTERARLQQRRMSRQGELPGQLPGTRGRASRYNRNDTGYGQYPRTRGRRGVYPRRRIR